MINGKINETSSAMSTGSLRDIFYCNQIEELIDGEGSKTLENCRSRIKEGDALIVRGVFNESLVERIKEYLATIGKSSLPQYQAIIEGCANTHRVVNWDKRSYTKGCFHQFSFLPWNQDVFGFFDIAKPIYQLKNLLGGLPKNSFIDENYKFQCVPRISFQFYPCGKGGMNRHRDPVDEHQLTVPLMLLGRKGVDYLSGGCFAEDSQGKQIVLDDFMNPGDVLFFNAAITHGVKVIDPNVNTDWLDFKGRWSAVFAINKLHNSEHIGNAEDLGEVSD